MLRSFERNASFSPEGNQVAYEWNNDSGSHIFIKVAGAGDAVQLTTSASEDFGPAWSHDGRFIAFVRRLAPTSLGVFVIPAWAAWSASWLSSPMTAGGELAKGG